MRVVGSHPSISDTKYSYMSDSLCLGGLNYDHTPPAYMTDDHTSPACSGLAAVSYPTRVYYCTSPACSRLAAAVGR